MDILLLGPKWLLRLGLAQLLVLLVMVKGKPSKAKLWLHWIRTSFNPGTTFFYKIWILRATPRCENFFLSMILITKKIWFYDSLIFIMVISILVTRHVFIETLQTQQRTDLWQPMGLYIDGILPKGPYPPCLRMADRALLAGYTRYVFAAIASWRHECVTWFEPKVDGRTTGESHPASLACHGETIVYARHRTTR